MKATRDFACVHAFYQRRQAAEIAHAAACKLQIMYTPILDRELDITRTCAVRCVCIFLFHCVVAFVYISKKSTREIPGQAEIPLSNAPHRPKHAAVHPQTKRSPTWVGCVVSATIPKVSRDTFRVGDDGCVLEVGLEPTQPVMAKGF